jgi:transcriptional regulator with XRE-family HTH domain
MKESLPAVDIDLAHDRMDPQKMKSVLIQVGRRIRELRMEAGLTQEELAERADLHPTYLGGVERGERNVSLNNLSKVAAALHVPLRSLVAFQDDHHDHDRAVETVKQLIVEERPRMDLFFSAFCTRCKYLNSFIDLEGTRDPFMFCAVSCANYEPLMVFRDFVNKMEDDHS